MEVHLRKRRRRTAISFAAEYAGPGGGFGGSDPIPCLARIYEVGYRDVVCSQGTTGFVCLTYFDDERAAAKSRSAPAATSADRAAVMPHCSSPT